LEAKNFEEIEKLTKILLNQNDQLKQKLTRIQRQNDEFVRNIQAQVISFNREKFQRESLLQQLARERDELRTVIGRAATQARTVPLPLNQPRLSGSGGSQGMPKSVIPLRATLQSGQRFPAPQPRSMMPPPLSQTSYPKSQPVYQQQYGSYQQTRKY